MNKIFPALYQPAPVEAVQVTRPFAQIVRLLPGAARIKGDRFTIGVLVPERADGALTGSGSGAAAMEGDWVITRSNGSYHLVSDHEFRVERGFAPVRHATAA